MELTAVALLIGTAIWARIMQHSWLAPGAFFSLLWCIAAVPATILLPNDVTAKAVLFVYSFALAVVLGSQAMFSPVEKSIVTVRGRRYDPKVAGGERLTILSTFVAAFAACGILANIEYIRDAHYNIAQLVHASTWIKIAVHYSIARYHQGYTESFGLRLLLAINYAGAFTGGVLLGAARSNGKCIIAIVPVISATFITLITTAKAPMLLSSAFCLAGWLSFRAAAPFDRSETKSARRLLVFLAVVATLGVVGTVSLMLRYGVGGADAGVITRRIGGYVFAQMAALSAWLKVENWNLLVPTWGKLTLAGLADILGLLHRTPGLYSPIGLNAWASQSNVFTAFRGAVTDFGFFGAWLGAVLFGMLGGCCYSRLHQADRATALSMIGLVVFYSFTIWSPVISIFAYNVVLFAVALAGVTLCISWREISSCAKSTGQRAEGSPRAKADPSP